MTTAAPAVYADFSRTVAFAARTLTATLRQRLAERDIAPATWYTVYFLTSQGRGVSRDLLLAGLTDSRNVDADAAPEALARLEADGLITGGSEVRLTAKGSDLYRSLREYLAGPTAELLSQFPLADIETTVRTLQAITAAAEQATER